MGAKIQDYPGGSSGPVNYGSPPGFAIAFDRALGNDVTDNSVINSFRPTEKAATIGLGFSDMTHRVALGAGFAQQVGAEFGGTQYWAPGGVFIRCLYLGWYSGGDGDIDAGPCSDAAYSASLPMSALYLGGRCQARVMWLNLNTSTGNQSFTGFGFKPDLILTIGGHPFSASPPGGSIGFPDSGAAFSLGAADKDGNQWAMAGQSVLGSGPFPIGGIGGFMNRFSRFRDDACLLALPASGYGQTVGESRASFVSMDTDGFTLSIDAMGGNSVPPATFGVLAVKVDVGHGQIKVGTQIAGTTPINVGFEPDAMLFGTTQSEGTTNEQYAHLCVGAATHQAQRGMWLGGDSGAFGVGGPNPFQRMDTTHAIFENGAMDARAILINIGATLAWDSFDGHAYKIGYVAFKIDDNTAGTSQAVTNDATDVTCGSATLHGTATPNDTGVTARFAWGTTTAYGSFLAAGTVSGSSPIAVSASLTGLLPLTTYHYRLELVKGGCVYVGADKQFTTPKCPVGVHHDPREHKLMLGADPPDPGFDASPTHIHLPPDASSGHV